MPRRDGTGPVGVGPMTGRGLGFCSGYDTPVYGNGIMRGQGFRRMNCYSKGYRGRYFASHYAYAAIDEKQVLTDEIDYLEQQLKNTKKRLDALSDQAE